MLERTVRKELIMKKILVSHEETSELSGNQRQPIEFNPDVTWFPNLILNCIWTDPDHYLTQSVLYPTRLWDYTILMLDLVVSSQQQVRDLTHSLLLDCLCGYGSVSSILPIAPWLRKSLDLTQSNILKGLMIHIEYCSSYNVINDTKWISGLGMVKPKHKWKEKKKTRENMWMNPESMRRWWRTLS